MTDSVDFELRAVTDRVRALVAEEAVSRGLQLSVAIGPGVPAALVGDPHALASRLADLIRQASARPGNRAVELTVDRMPGDHLALRFCAHSVFGEDSAICIESVFRPGDPPPHLLADMVAPIGADARHSLRVLLVEDNLLNLELAQEVLAEAGFAVDTATDGESAIAKVLSQPYSLVLMDVQMPVMDGLSATRAIRRVARLDGLPVVALTANALSSDRELCLAAGMDDYLAKPVEPGQLVRKALHWARQGRGPARPLPEMTVTGAPPVAPAAIPVTPAPTAPTAPASGASALMAGLSRINGLDAQRGLMQSRGRETLYGSLLRKFVSGEREFGERIRQALEASDWETAERCAHSLKGASALVGALSTREQAERLELAIRRRAPMDELLALCAAVEAPLVALLDALDAVL